jgi:hypothetical protein
MSSAAMFFAGLLRQDCQLTCDSFVHKCPATTAKLRKLGTKFGIFITLAIANVRWPVRIGLFITETDIFRFHVATIQ